MCHSKNCESKAWLSSYIQIPYHLGRATTYGCLGFVAALLSKQVAALSVWPYLSSAMLLIAGLIFILSSFPGCRHNISLKSVGGKYFGGVLLGFMPCSLIYALLMVAATTASPLKAMVGMWIFVIGTLPALFIVGVGAAKITQEWRDIVQKIGHAMMALNGLILLIMAAKLVK